MPRPPFSRDLVQTALGTFAGLTFLGVLLVPVFRPSIVVISLLFGWANGMIAFAAWRLWQRPRLSASDVAFHAVEREMVAYRYAQPRETPREGRARADRARETTEART